MKVKPKRGHGGLFREAICGLCQRKENPETVEGWVEEAASKGV